MRILGCVNPASGLPMAARKRVHATLFSYFFPLRLQATRYLFPVKGRRQGGADHGRETVQHAASAFTVAEEWPHLGRQGFQAPHALRVHNLAVLEGLEPRKKLVIR